MFGRIYEAFFVEKRKIVLPFCLGRIFVLARRVHPAIADGLAGAFVLFLINYDYFLTYLRLPLPAGFDGASHLAAGIEYAKNIFPSFWGWTPKWQLGMPFPVFYPPLFYFFFAFLSKLFYFFPSGAIFKPIVISSVLLVPAAFAFLSYKIEKTRVSAWFSSMASAFAISTFGPYGNIGLNLYSTFNVGLVTQALSLPMFVFWFCSLIGMENSRFRFVFSTLALSLVALSSAHMIFQAVFVVFFVWFYLGCSGLILACPDDREPQIFFRHFSGDWKRDRGAEHVRSFGREMVFRGGCRCGGVYILSRA